MPGRELIVAIVLALSSAAAAADEPPICADRPGKANPTCTVPAGMVQIETGIADSTEDRAGGVTADSLAVGATAFKYGVNDRWHLELDVAPYNRLHVRGSGLREQASSFGEVFVRSKYRFTSGDGIQLAIDPFVKIPTAARPIGNRRWEGGVAVAIDYAIPQSPLNITLGPELDWVADSDRHGHHWATTQVAALGWQVSGKVNLAAELWGEWDWDPAGTVRQATADAAAAYLVNRDLQLDAGANFGLNRQSPDVELYAGVSTRF
jgi:hypothetical protein